MSRGARPVYLDLLRIHLPISGWVSILHRISGVLLFLAIPLSVYLLERSLQGPQGFAEVAQLLGHPVMMLVGVLLVWSLLHHLLAGIRFLLLDLDLGGDAAQARATARWVLAAALVATVVVLVRWWS